MGRISDPACQELAEDWSERILSALDDLGQKTWPSITVKRGFLAKPQVIVPYTLEGPMEISGRVCWAIAHIHHPSTFSVAGTLSAGERDFWMVSLRPGSPPSVTIEGAKVVDRHLSEERDWQAALDQAAAAGPKREEFYGNKGPLRHRQNRMRPTP